MILSLLYSYISLFPLTILLVVNFIGIFLFFLFHIFLLRGFPYALFLCWNYFIYPLFNLGVPLLSILHPQFFFLLFSFIFLPSSFFLHLSYLVALYWTPLSIVYPLSFSLSRFSRFSIFIYTLFFSSPTFLFARVLFRVFS